MNARVRNSREKLSDGHIPSKSKTASNLGSTLFFFKKKAQEPMELQFQNNMEKAYEKGKAGNEARTDRMED